MRRSALALIAAVAALDVLSGTSAAWAFYDCEDYYYRRCRGFVIPCSLDGVNPAYHPLISAIPGLPERNMDSSDPATVAGTSRRTACAVPITAVESRRPARAGRKRRREEHPEARPKESPLYPGASLVNYHLSSFLPMR